MTFRYNPSRLARFPHLKTHWYILQNTGISFSRMLEAIDACECEEEEKKASKSLCLKALFPSILYQYETSQQKASPKDHKRAKPTWLLPLISAAALLVVFCGVMVFSLLVLEGCWSFFFSEQIMLWCKQMATCWCLRCPRRPQKLPA